MLIGRDDERLRLRRALDAGRPVALVGPAGIGKTSLLREVAAATGRTVHEGGALASLSWRSYLPLGRLIRDPDLAGPRSTVAAAVAERTADATVVLDDLHWADPDTLALLPVLAWRATDVLAAVRTADVGTAAATRALSAAGFEVVELGPLDDELAARVVRQVRPALSDTDVASVVAHAGGNPLLLAELPASGAPSTTLLYVLGARLRRCTPAARRSMQMLGLLARPATPEIVGPGVSELVEAGLAEIRDGLVEARHALLADSAVEAIPDRERIGLHRTLAAVITDPGEAARHHAAAGDATAARENALRAAAATDSPGERAGHLRLAAEQDGDAELRLAAAAALILAGDRVEAERLACSVVSQAPQVRAHVLLLRARTCPVDGRVEVHRRHVEDGLALVAGSGSDVEVGLMIERAWSAVGLMYDAETAVPLAERAYRRARDAGVEEDRALSILRLAQRAAGVDPERAAGSSAPLRGPGDAGWGRCATALEQVFEAFVDGRLRAADDLCAQLAGECDEALLADWSLQFRVAATMVELPRRGATQEFVERCRGLLAEPLLPRMRASVVARTAVAVGDLGRVADGLDLVRRALPQAVESTGRAHLLWARAELELAAGQPDRAVGSADGALAEDVGWHPVVTHARIVRMWARAASGLPWDEPGPWQQYPVFDAAPVESAAVRALTEGDPAGAGDGFVEAARLWHGRDRRAEFRCRWASGEATLRRGDVDGAVRMLRDLETDLRIDGPVGLLGRTRRSLLAAGARTPRSAGRDGLTARELQVLELVGLGLGSAAIADRLGTAASTVDAQLRSARRKLGARTRWEAATMLERKASGGAG